MEKAREIREKLNGPDFFTCDVFGGARPEDLADIDAVIAAALDAERKAPIAAMRRFKEHIEARKAPNGRDWSIRISEHLPDAAMRLLDELEALGE